MIEAHPLHWPPAWPRTEQPEAARFSAGRTRYARGASMTAARDHLLEQLRMMGVDLEAVVISTNMPTRLDGLPYANAREPEDSGVAVYWTDDEGEQRCVPCDRWDRVADNIRAIGLTVEALRGLDRWGTHRIVKAAFGGFKALPETSAVAGRPSWWEVLGLDPAADLTLDDVRRAYRRKARDHHPDTGDGDAATMAALQEARRQAESVVLGR